MTTNAQDTHDIQSVEVDVGLEMVEISCHRRSTAIGCLMVALHWDRDTPPMYRAVHKCHPSDEETRFKFDIESTHFYEIRSNQIPGIYPAVSKRLPRMLHAQLPGKNKHIY